MSPAFDLFDTHVHLNSARFEKDQAEVLARARASGVRRLVIAGYDLESSRRALELAQQDRDVFATVGLHPHDAAQWSADGPALRKLVSHPRVVALGEMGLDFYRNLAPEDDQRGAFALQLLLALEVGKPVVIHDRDAHAAVVELLREFSTRVRQSRAMAPPYGVLHCFSGDLEMAEHGIALGFLISIAGPVTYPTSDLLREVVRAVPLEHLVLETDAPYLPPQPWRGKRNEPAYLRRTAEAVAELKGLPLETVAAVTTANANRLFRLPPAAGTTA